MSTEDANSLKMTTETALDGPFGKRIYDEVVSQKIKNVTKLKFWVVFLPLCALLIISEVRESVRVKKNTANTIEFEKVKNEIRIEGDKYIIPPLVLHFQRTYERPAWTRVKSTPIQVLSFTNATAIPPGAEAKAVLLTGATNGLIKARLTEPLKVDGVSLLEAGVLLIGQGRSTEERLYVDFKKAVYKDGKTVAISAQAYDASDTILGLKGSRVGDATLKLAASSGLYFLSGMATGLQGPSFDANGRPRRLSTGEAALNGVSQASSEQAKSYMESIKNRPPLIEVKSGTTFVVTFDGEE